jgi:hypothetical protein
MSPTPADLPAALAAGHHGAKKKAHVTVEAAVDAYLRDAKSRELEASTLSKLETIFRKQFSSSPGQSRKVTSFSTRSISMS